MEAEAILTTAKSSAEPPHNWIVYPLLREKVILGMLGWLGGIIIGLGLFLLVFPIVVPDNYVAGIAPAIVSTIILGLLLFTGLGSLYLLISDLLRLRDASNHIIVITPEDFVKQEGKKIVHVPLSSVRYITTRGVPQPDNTAERDSSVRDMPSAGESMAGFLLGRGLIPTGQRWRRKRRRGPISLAFLDTRTNAEVVVARDTSYGDLHAIAATLEEYASAAQPIIRS